MERSGQSGDIRVRRPGRAGRYRQNSNATEDELRRRKLAAETVLAELQTTKARGEVGSLDEFERQVTSAAIEIRTRLQQMAVRVAPMVAGLKVSEVKRILRDEVDQALTVLADELGGSRD